MKTLLKCRGSPVASVDFSYRRKAENTISSTVNIHTAYVASDHMVCVVFGFK